MPPYLALSVHLLLLGLPGIEFWKHFSLVVVDADLWQQVDSTKEDKKVISL